MNIRNLKDNEIGDYTELFNKAEFNDPEFKLLTEEKMRERIFTKPHHTLDGYYAAFCEADNRGGDNGGVCGGGGDDGRMLSRCTPIWGMRDLTVFKDSRCRSRYFHPPICMIPGIRGIYHHHSSRRYTQ